MKTLSVVFIAIVVLSSVSFASGLRCIHPQYHVSIDNAAQMSADGQEVPMLLTVSTKAQGKILKLENAQIKKSTDSEANTYSGEGHLTQNGHFASVQLSVQTTPAFDEIGPVIYEGDLTLTIDGEIKTATLSCFEVSKTIQQADPGFQQ